MQSPRKKVQIKTTNRPNKQTAKVLLLDPSLFRDLAGKKESETERETEKKLPVRKEKIR